MSTKKICIVGAGIIGLSCGIRLQETLGRDYQIVIYADKFLEDTTSDVAAGGVRPSTELTIEGYKGKRTNPGHDTMMISKARWEYFLNNCDPEVTGIHRIKGYEIYYPGLVNSDKPPYYVNILDTYRKVTSHEISVVFPALPEGCGGYFVETYMISPRQYMKWLTKRFLENGGKIIKEEIRSFDRLFDVYDVVFNCTGLGATKLTPDEELKPNRGQVVRVDTGGNALKTFAYIHTGTPMIPYYYWTPNYTIVGGTRLPGDGSTEVSEEHHKMIMGYADTYFPWLKATEEKVVRKSVGLRPSRPSARIEREERNHKGRKKWVIHNYGHCGHGIMMSWGSACLAVELINDILWQPKM